MGNMLLVLDVEVIQAGAKSLVEQEWMERSDDDSKMMMMLLLVSKG
jgi:hypothetical protein